MRLSLLPTLAALGCGRFAFEPQQLSSDALVTPPACTIAATAPDPLLIMGETFEYTSFDNQSVNVNDVSVVARAPGGGTLASTTSDGTGMYLLSIFGQGGPFAASLVAQKTSYFTTTVYSDLPFDRAVQGLRGAVLSPGDLPVWDAVSMTAVYNTASETVDATRGTLNVALRDCDGNPIAGVAVTITPAPKRVFYQNAMGTSSNTVSTTLPFTHALGLAAQPGLTTVAATAPGLVFPTVQVDVLAGTNNTLVILHGAPQL